MQHVSTPPEEENRTGREKERSFGYCKGRAPLICAGLQVVITFVQFLIVVFGIGQARVVGQVQRGAVSGARLGVVRRIGRSAVAHVEQQRKLFARGSDQRGATLDVYCIAKGANGFVVDVLALADINIVVTIYIGVGRPHTGQFGDGKVSKWIGTFCVMIVVKCLGGRIGASYSTGDDNSGDGY
jgi:hypothetical protein